MANDVKFIRFGVLKLFKSFEDKDVASLTWGIRMGFPRVTVFTSNDNTKPIYDRMITGTFDLISFNMFVNLLKEVPTFAKGEAKHIECLNVKYVNNEKTNDIYVQAKVVVGKDEDGVNYMAVLEDNKRKVKFQMLPGKFHRFYNKDKKLIEDKEQLSNDFVRAYSDILPTMINPNVINDGITEVNAAKKSTYNDKIEDDIGI